MRLDYDHDGFGVAQDGSSFSPAIPAGATVSWKRLDEPTYVPEQDRVATHLLAVWDRLEEMDVDEESLRDTPRGPCVAFYTDVEALEALIESAAPAPAWINAEVPTELVVAEFVIAAREDYLDAYPLHEGPRLADEVLWLRTAIWTHRMLTDRWPILETNPPEEPDDEPEVLEEIRRETDGLFRIMREELREQRRSRWWERRSKIVDG
jgi:hypothetical protein